MVRGIKDIENRFKWRLYLLLKLTWHHWFIFKGSESSKVVLMWRGGTWKPSYSEVSNFDTWDWKPSTTLISGQGARPYIKYTSSYNKENNYPRVHMAFTDGHPRNEPTNSIYYAYLENNFLYKGKIIRF